MTPFLYEDMGVAALYNIRSLFTISHVGAEFNGIHALSLSQPVRIPTVNHSCNHTDVCGRWHGYPQRVSSQVHY
jgi:hypothetical protein